MVDTPPLHQLESDHYGFLQHLDVPFHDENLFLLENPLQLLLELIEKSTWPHGFWSLELDR